MAAEFWRHHLSQRLTSQSCHPMNNAEFQLRGVGDPRLAVHATSALPAWLWSTDGTRILWGNPVGARLFGAAKPFGPADPHRRQVTQLAGRLLPTGATRLGENPERGMEAWGPRSEDDHTWAVLDGLRPDFELRHGGRLAAGGG